ncbi:MAG: hypothetical protein JWP81_3820 [Ferruginibacter sp.]|nr:hypothetical protein [Ferruginibacter sp.]
MPLHFSKGIVIIFLMLLGDASHAQMQPLINGPVDISPNVMFANGFFSPPGDNGLYQVAVTGTQLRSDPLSGTVKWNIHSYKSNK